MTDLDWDCVSWQFELLLGAENWVTYDRNLLGFETEHSEVHEITDFWDHPVQEWAARELDNALEELLGFGSPLGARSARIVAWPACPPSGPSLVVEATEAQLAVARLSGARFRVEMAERALERAHAELRNQVLRSVTVDGLDRRQ